MNAPALTRLCCCLALLLVAPLTAARAQTSTPAQFQDILRLAQDGYGDSARVLISKVLAQTPTSDPLFAEALYTAATIAKSGEEMRSYFTRVAIEFSKSPWAEKAMLRLAQLDYGGGNSESAVARVRRIFKDYPNSTILPTAALWGSRAAFDRKEMQLACDWLTKGIAAVGDDVELRNQLEYSKQRCNVGPGLEVATAQPDSLREKPAVEKAPSRADSLRGKVISTPVTAPKPRDPTPAPASAGTWRVQVAAISDKAAIKRAVGKIERAGFRAFQVAGPRGLTKLQAGPFKTRDDAVAKIGVLRAAFGGAPFAVQAP